MAPSFVLSTAPSMACLEVLAGADDGDVVLLAVLDAVEQAAVAHVAGVVVGHGDDVDAALGHRRREVGIALDDDVLPALGVAAGGERALQVHEAEVALLEGRRDALEEAAAHAGDDTADAEAADGVAARGDREGRGGAGRRAR